MCLIVRVGDLQISLEIVIESNRKFLYFTYSGTFWSRESNVARLTSITSWTNWSNPTICSRETLEKEMILLNGWGILIRVQFK